MENPPQMSPRCCLRGRDGVSPTAAEPSPRRGQREAIWVKPAAPEEIHPRRRRRREFIPAGWGQLENSKGSIHLTPAFLHGQSQFRAPTLAQRDWEHLGMTAGWEHVQ